VIVSWNDAEAGLPERGPRRPAPTPPTRTLPPRPGTSTPSPEATDGERHTGEDLGNATGGLESGKDVGRLNDLELIGSNEFELGAVNQTERIVKHVCVCKCPECPVMLNNGTSGTPGLAMGFVSKRDTPGFDWETFIERHPLALYMCIFSVVTVVFLTLTWFVCRSMKKG